MHGGIANRVNVESRWILAELFEQEDPTPHLEGCHAILIPGGFGERGIEGKIRAAGFARERQVPYFGICLGMQVAVIEAIRNLLGISNAGSEEFDTDMRSDNPGIQKFEHVVYHLGQWLHGDKTMTRTQGDQMGATMRLGAYPANLDARSRVAGIYGSNSISERHRHRYEIGMNYRHELEKHGIVFSGMSPDGALPEILEINDHPWFVGVQFHPELKSRPFSPHPLFADFIRAASRTIPPHLKFLRMREQSLLQIIQSIQPFRNPSGIFAKSLRH